MCSGMHFIMISIYISLTTVMFTGHLCTSWEMSFQTLCSFSFIFKKMLFIFRERGRVGEREGAKNWSVASCMPPTQDLTQNSGMYPDWKLNWFGRKHSIYWATLVRALWPFVNCVISLYYCVVRVLYTFWMCIQNVYADIPYVLWDIWFMLWDIWFENIF